MAAIAINVIEPTFESQTKIKLGSLSMAPEKDSEGNPYPLSGVSVNKFVGDFVKEQVDNYLHKHPDVAEVLLQKNPGIRKRTQGHCRRHEDSP